MRYGDLGYAAGRWTGRSFHNSVLETHRSARLDPRQLLADNPRAFLHRAANDAGHATLLQLRSTYHKTAIFSQRNVYFRRFHQNTIDGTTRRCRTLRQRRRAIVSLRDGLFPAEARYESRERLASERAAFGCYAANRQNHDWHKHVGGGLASLLAGHPLVCKSSVHRRFLDQGDKRKLIRPPANSLDADSLN